MAGEWIAPLHMVAAILTALYGFLFPKNALDSVYLVVMYLILLHWTFLNSECIVTYYFKKVNDPTYVAGKDASTTEVDALFKDYPNTIQVGMFLKKLVWTMSIYIVLKRCHFSQGMTLAFPGLFLIYYIVKIFTEDHYKNEPFLIIQEIIKYSTILYGILFFSILYKKL
jgi:hypothetical protein